MPRRPGLLRGLAGTLLAVNVALALATAVLRVMNRDVDLGRAFVDPEPWFWAIQVVSTFVWTVPGVLMARRRPDLPFGWLALGVGLTHGLTGAGFEWAVAATLGGRDLPAGGFGLWLWNWAPPVEVAALGLIYLLLPYGRKPSGWLGRFGAAAVAGEWIAVVAGALEPVDTSIMTPESPLAGLDPPVSLDLPIGVLPLLPICALAVGAFMVVRWLRSEGEERQMLRWLTALVVVGPFVLVAVLFLPWGASLAQVSTYLEVATITAVVLRYRLFGVEVVLNRALLYTALTAVLAAVYGAVVAGANAVLPGDGASFAGAMAAAFALSPARTRLQRAVNRFMYGQRDDPYAVVSGVSRQLAAATSPDQLLSGVVGSVADALRLPYVAIRLTTEEEPITIETGGLTAGAATERMELRHQGQVVGELVAGVRAGETEFRPNERRLLEQLADQAGVAAGAVSLTLALQRSRERLVVAREEERRRLRRDLHDGLGPTLTASAFTIDTARNVLDRDPEAADRLLAAVRAEVAAAIDDIRRLVYGLRPPALDELGLVGALRQHIARLDGSADGLAVQVEAPDDLPALPAAVEVAAYRIATEAVTNAARHSGARRCTLRVTCNGDLVVEVRDDGSHAGGDWQAGVGMASMRERAAEVGGVCEIGPTREGGGRVAARLPLHTA